MPAVNTYKDTSSNQNSQAWVMKEVNGHIRQVVIGVLYPLISEYAHGLRKKANLKHAGNCWAMSCMLRYYLYVLFNIKTEIVNVKVRQRGKNVNHYYLLMDNGIIIDGTASQFRYPNGRTMPKVYMGERPSFYKDYNIIKFNLEYARKKRR